MLPTEYQQFIHLSRYARWDYEKGRRETWHETIERYFNFFTEHLEENHGFKLENGKRVELEDAVRELKVMPSMRCLMTAGEALKKENVSGYNCSYIKVDNQRSFDEILYVLMNGTGVGFSVEEEYCNKLPFIPEELYETETTIVVADSKLGWARAFKELISLLYGGHIPKWDVSKVRPAGAPLKTFGGRASGPAPLVDLFNFTVGTFNNAKGRKLKPIECHDIVCKTAEIVVVGGVRRSALISLSNLNDREMRFAKSGQWWEHNVHRALANNSVNYKEKPDVGTFMREWLSLYDSKSGERGFYSSMSAQKHVESLNNREKDKDGVFIQRRVAREDFGTNPCSEIILRSREFCNLSEVVLRSDDTIKSISNKIRIATILGTFQSTLTNFKYLSREWKRNCDEERLLGVSLTGIMDCPLTNGANGPDKLEKTLIKLREVAVETNKEWAEKLGISRSAAITCVKPSGCFEKNQEIKTNKGILSLDEIFKMNGIDLSEKENDYREWYEISKELIVYDENNEEQSITKLFVNGVEETIKFTLEDGEIVECTPNHKFKLTDGSWKEAKDLTEDDDIMKIVKKEISKNLTVDIEVSGTHTYQLSNGCIVHNTVSQLVDSASGIHARHNPYYIRTVRADNKDPLCQMMKEQGFPNEPDVTKPDHTTVFSFPSKSPEGAICRTEMSAWKQLSLWHSYAKHWCEHKPSVTVSIKEDEWVDTASWVYANFNDISGISFLPFSDHTYQQAPYQDCTEKEYKTLLNKMPKNVDWSSLAKYESQDYTSSSQEFACSADKGCEIVDITSSP